MDASGGGLDAGLGGLGGGGFKIMHLTHNPAQNAQQASI